MAKILMLRIAPWGDLMHGGQLRTHQIAELVTGVGDVAARFTAPNIREEPKLRLAIIGLRAVLRAIRDLSLPLEAFLTEWTIQLLVAKGLCRGDVVVYDADRRFGPSLVRACRQLGVRLVVLPQNIEALIPVDWPIRVDIDTATKHLRRDLHWLAQADAICTIGAVDRDILELFGLQVSVLPYAPVATRRAELLAVRAARVGRADGPLLIIGTLGNRPTHAGMLEQLQIARALGAAMPQIIIAGFGTEELAVDAPPGTTIVGSQSWPALLQLMTEASALWVHQAPMTGALTRIPEALIAGLPVLGNHWATRNYERIPGVLVYEDDTQLKAQLAALPSDIPLPDIVATEAVFLRLLRDLLGDAALQPWIVA
jgi:hypothetical protein